MRVPCFEVVVCVTAVLWTARVAEADGPRLREDAGHLSRPRPRGERAEPSVPEPPAHASSPPRTHFELFAESTAPIDVGARLRFVLGGQFVVELAAGGGVYGNAYASLAERFGGEDVAPLIAEIANGARGFRGRIGLRLCHDCGFEVMVGIARLHTQDRIAGTSLAKLMGEESMVERLDLAITLRYVDVELGWTISVGRRFFIRPAIGVLRIRRARVQVAMPEDAPEEIVTGMRGAMVSLGDGLEAHGICPMLSLGIGVRLGRAGR